MNLNYDIQKIELVLREAVLNGGVSKNVFMGQRPSVVNESMSITKSLNDFVVVKVPTSVRDRAAIGECICRIEWFVRNEPSGLKNSVKLSAIYSKLESIFPIQNDTYVFDIYNDVMVLGNDNENFHVQAININTIIKTI
ncbi:MAG: hypothetical protein QM660_10820 [Dysgonomonas sp.]